MSNDDIRDRFAEGIRLFNEGKYYDSHDVLEDIWFEIRGESRTFYQGLIHLAVGFHHLTVRHNSKGAESQLKKAIAKLDAYKPEFQGVEIVNLLSSAETCLIQLKKYQKEDIIDPEEFQIPKINFEKDKFEL